MNNKLPLICYKITVVIRQNTLLYANIKKHSKINRSFGMIKNNGSLNNILQANWCTFIKVYKYVAHSKEIFENIEDRYFLDQIIIEIKASATPVHGL